MPFITRTSQIEDDWERRTKKTWWKPKGHEAEPEILLRQVGKNAFHLMEGFRYELPERDRRSGEQHRWDVPPHRLDLAPDEPGKDNSTDLASVPPWLWWFIASHGRQTRAALLHDHLIGRDETLNDQADRAFRIALIESDVSVLRAWLMWTAVSLATTARDRLWGRVAVAAYALHLLAFIGTLFYWWLGRYSWWPLGWLSPRLEGGVWWPLAHRLWASDAGEPLYGVVWLVPLILGLAGLLVWRLRLIFGVIGVVVIAVPTIAVWVTYCVIWLLDWAVTLVYRFIASVGQLDIRIPSPSFGRPFRREGRPF